MVNNFRTDNQTERRIMPLGPLGMGVTLSTGVASLIQGWNWTRENVVPVIASGFIGSQVKQMVDSKNWGGLAGTVVGVGYEFGKDAFNSSLSLETLFRAALTGTLFRAAGEVVQRGIENPRTILPTVGGAGGGALLGYIGTLFMAPDMTVAQSAEVVTLGATLGGMLASDVQDGKALDEFGTLAGTAATFAVAGLEGNAITPETFEDANLAAMFIRAAVATVFDTRRGEINTIIEVLSNQRIAAPAATINRENLRRP